MKERHFGICGWGPGHHLQGGCRSLMAGSSSPHPNESKSTGRKVVTFPKYLEKEWEPARGWEAGRAGGDYSSEVMESTETVGFCQPLCLPEEEGAVQRPSPSPCGLGESLPGQWHLQVG